MIQNEKDCAQELQNVKEMTLNNFNAFDIFQM